MNGLSRTKVFLLAGTLSLCLVVALAICGPATATDFDFTGTIVNHNDVVLFGFLNSGGLANVTAFTSYYDDGGFDPILTVYNVETGNRLAANDDGGIQTINSNAVPYTTGVFDSYLNGNVPNGLYVVALTAFNNFSAGANFLDGFAYDAATPISIGTWTGGSTGDFQFHILNVDGARVVSRDEVINRIPEPSSLLLLGSGLVVLAAALRRKLTV